MMAVNYNHIDIVRKLLVVGSNPNIRNNKGDTALMIAVKHNYIDIIRGLLINQKTEVKLKNKIGLTAFDLAKSKSIQADIIRRICC